MYSAVVFTALLAYAAAQSSGGTYRYWDCCKASCAWPGKSTAISAPVQTCQRDGTTVNSDTNAQSGCDGGNAYMCASQQPWVINANLSYGFAAASISGQTEQSACCACYQLSFTSAPVVGKRFIVQVTNTGSDLGNNIFDLEIPGGGVGLFNGCSTQYGSPTDGWGERYGGVSADSECSNLPTQLQPGCHWRFDWFGGADNPNIDFTRVTCPTEISSRTGCVRSDN